MRRALTGCAIGAAAAAVAWLAGLAPIARGLEADAYDWRLARTARPVHDAAAVAIVEINESSLRALEPVFGRWPWPRAVHAAVIDYLAAAGARAIVYDVLFLERDARDGFSAGGRSWTGAESDAELVAAVGRAGTVVLAAEATWEGLLSETGPAAGPPELPGVTYRPGAGFQTRPHLRLPFAELARAARGVGHNVLVLDPDGTVRRMLPFIEVAGVAVPSIGLAGALAAVDPPVDVVRLDAAAGGLRIGGRVVPLLAEPAPPEVPGGPPVASRQVLLPYPARVGLPDGSRAAFPTAGVFDVLLSAERAAAGEPPVLDPAMFRGRAVFVGTSAPGLGDVFTTPFEGAGASGALLHATLADAVIGGRAMRRAPAGVDAAWVAAAGLVAGAAAAILPVGWAAAVVAALAASLAWGFTRAVGDGVWIGLVPPLSAAALGLFGGVAWRYVVEGREKRLIRQLFGRYVSPDVFAALLADPSRARLGGDRREMSVLFADIRGFTAASESRPPEEVVAQLNEYFTEMVAALFRHRGTLDKFVGDMVMGLFGAPVADESHADHAVAAARDMAATLDRLNARWAAAGRPALAIGIGINTGEMIAGNIGSDTIMSYTAIGDAVNLGSRLESLTKAFGARIVIGEATRERLRAPVAVERLGEVTVKGRVRPVTVYAVREEAP